MARRGCGVQVLLTNASKYSKGMLSEILDFVMGQGLIPADGEVWKRRRRCVLPFCTLDPCRWLTSAVGPLPGMLGGCSGQYDSAYFVSLCAPEIQPDIIGLCSCLLYTF